MADTFTTILKMTLPEIGASNDTWGDKLNNDLDILDALFATTGQGTIIVRDTNNDALVTGINLTGAAGNARTYKIKTGTSIRWDIGADATAEGGSNAGSLFKINRYSDTAALLGTPVTIARDTGQTTFEVTPQVGSNAVIHEGNLSNIALPIGTPIPWLLDTLPSSGYLWMNGQAVSRTTYAALFALFGTKFGVGDASTTFNLPDWREVVPVGKSTMGGTAARGLITHLALIDTAAAPVGEGEHALTATEGPAHSHGVTDGGHSHGGGHSDGQTGNPQGWPNNVGSNVWFGTAQSTSVAATGITIQNAGGGAAHNNVQPSVVCNWCVKALP